MKKDHSHKPDPNEEGVPIEVRSDTDPPGDPRPSGGTISIEEFARLAAEKEELTNTLVRRQADFDNYRKRIDRERKEETRRGTGRMLQELLPVLDGFERALRSHDKPSDDEYRKGVQLIYRQLWDALSKNGLERILAEGKHFDPHYHEAIERVETHEYPDGTIIQVVQEGYLFDGKVLRPSLVRVAAAPEGTDGGKPSAEHFQVQ